MKTLVKLSLFVFLSFSGFVLTQESDDKPENIALDLDQLLELVKQGRFAEAEEAAEREERFIKEKNRQATLLANAKAERSRLEAEASRLEATFEANDAKLVLLEDQLKTRLGSLYETFGHLQGVASDTQATFETSLTSGQFGQDREVFLDDLAKKMGEGVSVATIEELERLWYELSRELVASGSVEKFSATVIDNNGDASLEEVVRIGNFNVVMLLGDNLSDFQDSFYGKSNVDKKKIVELEKKKFGNEFILFPNLIYGPWEEGFEK